MAVRVVTDSACDLPPEVCEQLGIEVVPLTIRFGDREYVDRKELTTEAFWQQRRRSAFNGDDEYVFCHPERGSKIGPEWYADELRAAFAGGMRRVNDALKQLRAEVLDEADWKRFDSAGRLFWNMNTVAEYLEAQQIIEAERS